MRVAAPLEVAANASHRSFRGIVRDPFGVTWENESVPFSLQK
jgi:hypothetical protein